MKWAFRPHERPLLLASSLYILPGFYFSWSLGNNEFILYAAVLVVLGGIVLLLNRTVQLHPAALWGLWLWGLAHLAGGLLPVPAAWPVNPGEPHVLYNLWLVPYWLKYDQLVHACGFGLTTWVCWQGLSRAFTNRGVQAAPTVGLLTLSAAAGMGFGALNEVIEFLATRLMPETNVGGYENTGWDLVFNLLGCLLAALWIKGSHACRHRPRPRLT